MAIEMVWNIIPLIFIEVPDQQNCLFYRNTTSPVSTYFTYLLPYPIAGRPISCMHRDLTSSGTRDYEHRSDQLCHSFEEGLARTCRLPSQMK